MTPDHTEPGQTELDRTELDRTELDRTGEVKGVDPALPATAVDESVLDAEDRRWTPFSQPCVRT
jgi:hypothetical protein